MSKFQVGEIAIWRPIYRWRFNGCEVEVVSDAGFPAGSVSPNWPVPSKHFHRYMIKAPDGTFGFASDSTLRKRPQRGIPQSVLNIFRLPVEA